MEKSIEDRKEITIKYHYLYIVPGDYGRWTVKGVDEWPEHSVLAGQVRKTFIESFETLDDAQDAYPDADVSHPIFEPQNTFSHLPDEPDY